MKPFSIGNVRIDPPLALAPMAEVTDTYYRSLIKELGGAGLVVSEKRGKSIVYELQMSVLEEALLGFAQVLGWRLHRGKRTAPKRPTREVLGQ